MPKLRRVSDGEGFSGSIAYAIRYREDKNIFDKVGNGEPIIGCSFYVGTNTVSTYSIRDYWVTSEVVEIIDVKKNNEDKLEYVKFRTKNSTYECFA